MNLESLLINLGVTRVYNSIRVIKQDVWEQIDKTGNFKLLLTRGWATPQSLRDAWDMMQQQYVDEFGIPDNYMNIMRMKYKRAIATAKYLQTRDLNYLQQVMILDTKIEAQERQLGKGISANQLYGLVVKEMRHVSLSQTSVYEYGCMVQLLIEKSKLNGKPD